MTKLCINVGPYIMKAYQEGYLYYIEFYSSDDLTCIVKFPLSLNLMQALDESLMELGIWGRSFSIETPCINTLMERYAIGIGNGIDFPNDETPEILEIFLFNANKNMYQLILSVPIDEDQVVNMRSLIYKVLNGGC